MLMPLDKMREKFCNAMKAEHIATKRQLANEAVYRAFITKLKSDSVLVEENRAICAEDGDFFSDEEEEMLCLQRIVAAQLCLAMVAWLEARHDPKIRSGRAMPSG